MRPNGPKRIRAKGWFLTYPRCEVSKEVALKELEQHGAIKEYVIAQERHEDGGLHLHAFIKFEKKTELTPDKFDIGEHHGNYQIAKCWKAVERYCKKGGDYIANIDIENAKMKKAKKNAELLKMDVCEAVDEGEISLFQVKSFVQNKEIYNLKKQKQTDEEKVNYWIVGEPGIGKSQWARRTFPNAFKKACNKWWDGYQGETAVIMDDLDTNVLGHYLKIWGDNYFCTGEVKGGTIPLTYKQMVITSNYKISQLWRDDKVMAAAIARRFKTYTVTGDYKTGYELAETTGYLEY